MGTRSFTDLLWYINSQTGEAVVFDDLAVTSGRNIDTLDLTVDESGSFIVFKNKLDDTLWFKNLEFGN